MTTMNGQPYLRLVGSTSRGIMYLGAKDGLYIAGSDLYAWENHGSEQFIGAHMPHLRNARKVGITDGMERLAQRIRLAHNEGYTVSYDLPQQAKKSGNFRALDADERMKLRTAQGLPQLKLAA